MGNRLVFQYLSGKRSGTFALQLAWVLALAVVLSAAWSVRPLCVHAASAHSEYTEGWKDYRDLARDPKRKKYRDNWKKVEAKFQKAYKLSPKGSTAPKSLYFIGRIYDEVGAISALRSDNKKSIEYFTKVIKRWPSHSWADDCYWYRGKVKRRMGDKAGAYADFRIILDKYSRSDMVGPAREEIAKLKKSGYKTADSESASKKTSKSTSKQAAKQVPKKTTDSASKSESEPEVRRAVEPPSSGSSNTGKKQPRYPVSKSNIATLKGIRFTSGDEYTRVTLDLDEKTKYIYQQLNPIPSKNVPHRLYFDLDATSVDRDVAPDISVSDGNLRRIRSSQNKPDTARVVLDFLDMQEYKIFALENPFRIVVDVFAPKDRPKAKSTSASKTSAKKGGSTEKPSKKVVEKVEPYKPSKSKKALAGDLVEQLGLTVKTVMIDPGHGGKDPGAHGNGLVEKKVNLRFAKLLGKKLKEKGFNVEYTRTKDVFVPLEDRTAMANIKKADLFLSVHCNANKVSSVNGLETYSLNLASSKHAVQVAARENALEPKHISDLQIILTDLMLSSKLKESKDLAGRVQSGAVRNARKRYSLKDHGVREAPFYVLMGAKMPSVLIELGYLTNRTEAKRLKSDAYLERLADGVVAGVLAYKTQIERFASI